jgi:hypothetical protein
MTALSDIVAKFRSSSPNIAAAFDEVERRLAKLEGGTPPAGWVCAPPQAPITTILNAPTLGLNVNNMVGQTYQDYVIDGTGDSAVLLQNATSRCKLQRLRLLRVANRSAVPQAKHAIYCKARENEFYDIYAEQGGNAASSLSVRMGNNLFQRTVLKGFNYVSYYEHDGLPGTVSFIDGDWEFTADTAVWGDDSNEPPTPYIKQAFLFQNIAAKGPGSLFLKFGPSAAGGGSYRGAGVTIKGCTLNGKPVTAAMVSGVPSDKLVIQ